MNQAMYHAFRRLGWGFVFEVIDFRVMYFDVLPDFVGYILIATALHQLSPLHSLFNKAKWLAIGLSVFTLPHILMQSNVSFSNFGSLPLGLHVYSEALLACHVLIVYWICNGFEDIARQKKLLELHTAVETRRNFYMVIAIAQLIFYPFLLNLEETWILMLFVFGGLQLIMELLFIRLPFRFSKALQIDKSSFDRRV